MLRVMHQFDSIYCMLSRMFVNSPPNHIQTRRNTMLSVIRAKAHFIYITTKSTIVLFRWCVINAIKNFNLYFCILWLFGCGWVILCDSVWVCVCCVHTSLNPSNLEPIFLHILFMPYTRSTSIAFLFVRFVHIFTHNSQQ